MATSQNQVKGWDRVVAWYARHSYAVNMIYSGGASVVIIGALFKIMHWPGAGIVLTAGMCTEAFLFLIGIFEKPHAVYNWENVYPQLIGHEVKEVLGGSGVAAEEKEENKVPQIEAKDMEALKKGIENLAATANQLSELGKVAEATNDLTGKMAVAGAAAEKFAGAQEGLVAQSAELGTTIQGVNTSYQTLGQKYQTVAADMEEAIKQTKVYGKGIEGVNAQMAALNSVYELQLKNIQSQAQAFNAQTEKIQAVNASVEAMTADVQKMQQAADEAVKAGAEYAANSKKLAAQIADLNKVYGNMLNALA